jgi:hypothetical protein
MPPYEVTQVALKLADAALENAKAIKQIASSMQANVSISGCQFSGINGPAVSLNPMGPVPQSTYITGCTGAMG